MHPEDHFVEAILSYAPELIALLYILMFQSDLAFEVVACEMRIVCEMWPYESYISHRGMATHLLSQWQI